jgi:hypothetical protein
MKTKFFISLSLLFLCNYSIAQKFKTSIILSPGISHLSSSNLEVKSRNGLIKNRGYKFSFLGSVREEYYFPKIISIGIGLEYLNYSGSFVSPAPIISVIPEIHTGYLHFLSSHSLDIPLLIRFRTNREMKKTFHFFCGFGMNYIFLTKRNIEMITTYDGTDAKDVIYLTTGKIKLKNKSNNQIGTIGILGFGKNFSINKLIFTCEAQYRFDFNKWYYPTVNDPNNIYFFGIKTNCFLFSIGMII